MSLTFMKNKYIDLSISFCYLVCLFLQNICLYFAQIFSNFNNYLPAYFEYVESVEGIGNSLDIPRAAKELYIIGNTPYYSIPMLLTAGQLTMYEAILGGGNHYIRFSVNRNGSGKIVITDAMQDGSTSNNARIALWYR